MNDVTAAAHPTAPDGSLLGMIKAFFGKACEPLPPEEPTNADPDGEFADEAYFGEYPFRCHGIYGGFGHY